MILTIKEFLSTMMYNQFLSKVLTTVTLYSSLSYVSVRTYNEYQVDSKGDNLTEKTNHIHHTERHLTAKEVVVVNLDTIKDTTPILTEVIAKPAKNKKKFITFKKKEVIVENDSLNFENVIIGENNSVLLNFHGKNKNVEYSNQQPVILKGKKDSIIVKPGKKHDSIN